MRSRFDVALGALGVTAAVASSWPARAEEPPAASSADQPAVDFMHVLAAHQLHDFVDERVNAYGQITLIGHYKAPFFAKYTNLNRSTKSLTPEAEGSWTATTTLFLAGRLWRGGEAYVVPELISEQPLSNLSGLGGAIQNGELQKGGVPPPTLYMARVYLRQTIGFGGAPVEKTSGQMQLGTVVDARRLVLTLGKFSTIDFLDKNVVAGDVRKQFLGLAFMTHAAWDFAADARGYTWGGLVELYLDDFALRFAHTLVPVNPNDLPMDYRLWKYFGDQLELEHVHRILGQRGSVRVLGYRNWEFMGRFDDAVAIHQADPKKNAQNALPSCPNYVSTPGYASTYTSTNPFAPDLCWARKPNAKLGIGVSVDQAIGDNVGVFVRAMYSDGQTEVFAYMPADRSLSLGALVKGTWWRRPLDSAGAAFGATWISKAHADYLGQGGIDGFIGDGALRQSAESTFELFYSVNVLPPLWFSVDYQHVTNPGYNADRGPVEIAGARLHAEF
jgi:hypothetical protein